MTSSDMLSINNVAAKLGLSVHQLRRWELMFGLEIKRGRGQQRQYREEDMSVLERIKELVEQGWPTSQIRPQLEAEGLLSPKLIGAPPVPGNPEVLQEAIIGLRNFSERRFIDLSKQIDELRQLVISVTLKQELSSDRSSPWQPMASEYVPAPKTLPPQEITIGPQISIDPPKSPSAPMGMPPTRVNQIPPNPPAASPAAGYSASTSASSAPGSTSSSGGEFSQRSIIGASNSPAAENKSPIPDIDQAPKPITDALQKSMSTLDSLFKDSRNTPGLGTASSDSNPALSSTSSTSSSSSLPAAAGAGQPPVRYSTIPPQPSSPTSAMASSNPTASSSPTTASAAANTSGTTNPSTASSSGNLASPTSPSTSISSSSQSPTIGAPGSAPLSAASSGSISSPAGAAFGAGSSSGQNPSLPSYAVKTSVEQPAVGSGGSTGNSPALSVSSPAGSTASTSSTSSLSSASSPSSSSTPADTAANAAASASTASTPAASAWDQAFSSTSVDIDAVPSSGLFDQSSAASTPSTTAPASGSPSVYPSHSAGTASSEHNPFTTITGTNNPALPPHPPGSPALMGQTGASSQGFGAPVNPSSSASAPPQLSQTGPLPAHTSVESFAPEQKEKLIASQSDSTSTELPQSQDSVPPAAVTAPPPLPLASGPQVNFGPNVSAPTPQATPQRMDDNFGLGEVTDQNYLTVLGRALDLIGWTDEQADSFSLKTFGVPHWDELGRSQAEKLVAHLVGLLKVQLSQ